MMEVKDIKPSDNQAHIAIVGMAGRFPGAKNIDEFWHNLCQGIVSIRKFSTAELEAAGVNKAELENPSFVNSGTVIEDADCFDAAFFGYSPFEAEIMDPQHRLLLECAWEALENAGYNPDTYNRPIGVFVGVSPNTYFQNILISRRDLHKKAGQQLIRISNEKEHSSTRISFKLNLKGPSINVNTACSSSGVALHLACQSILSGECDMALVGGARIDVPLKAGYFCEEGSILSLDGQCRAFDAKAQGTVFGDGVGLIVIKRLIDAIEDRDTIQAVIRGTAVNNDGSRKIGYPAPSIQGQAAVIAEALLMAEVHPDTIGYVEAHGTGTVLGDPIEIAALTKAYQGQHNGNGVCRIGSVKTNIGHLFAGAGIAGVIKTVLALKHKKIPPSLNFEKPNPQIDFANTPFRVNDKLSDWHTNGFPRRAGVSAFGVGGTNFHAILEEGPKVEPSGPSTRAWQLLLTSAKSSAALENNTANLMRHLKQYPHLNPADVAFTLNTGRKKFDHGRMIVCRSIDDAVTALEGPDPSRVLTSFQEPIDRGIVFMFPGQGAQYVNMGLELYTTEPVFRKQLDRCAEILKPDLGMDLRDILYPQKENDESAARRLNDTIIAQPALFTIEYALAKLWMSWGVHPCAFVGHSIGEYAAACMSGVFSLEDALFLVATRARLMQELPGGSMMAVFLSEKEIEPFLGQALSLAGINGPGLCVVSGTKKAVADLERTLSKKNIACRPLHTSHAFHSKMMEPVINPFIEKVKKIDLRRSQIPIVSTVTGRWITPDEMADPAYWINNMRRPVRFFDCVKELCKDSSRVLLEVGPGQTLITLARQHLQKSNKQITLSSIRHPNNKISDSAFILNTLGRLWLAGIQVNWDGFYEHEKRHRIPLPAYPFERQRYWAEPRISTQPTEISNKTSYEKENFEKWFFIPSWKRIPLPLKDDKRALKDRNHRWLVFLDESDVGSRLIKRLRQDGQHVSTVIKGDKFDRPNEEIYSINPRSQKDYKLLMEELHAVQQAPDTIVHLWSLTNNQQSLSDEDFLSSSLDSGFYSLLFLIQAIDEQFSRKQVKIKIVSNNLHDVTGDEVLSPEKATILGPCRVAPLEYPNIQCTNIDIILPEAADQKKDHIRLLMQELTLETDEPIVAYRGKYRWVHTFESMHLGKFTHLKPRVREKGVYLITGGLGGIGLTLAEYLAQTVQAKIILIARTVFPERSQWAQWLETHKGQDAMSRKILKLMSIEDMGAEVLVISADVTHTSQMKSAIDQACHRFGTIHGVIHAAGVAGGGMMQLKTAQTAEKVLSPKVKGTLVLDDLLKEIKLDFFVLCSSLISVSGGIGQVDYCAANAFMDAYAHQNHLQSNTLSINWCAWQEVGMAINTAIPDELVKDRKHRLKFGILPKEGQQAFDRILGTSLPQVIVTTHNFKTLADLSNDKGAPDSTEKAETTALPQTRYARPELSCVYVAPGNSTEKTIAEIWQQLLSIEKVGVHDNFFELGGHSLLVAQITSEMRKAFKTELPLGSLFESPTVHLLSKMIREKHKGGASFNKSKARGKKRKERIQSRI